MSEMDKELLKFIDETIIGVDMKNHASYLSLFQREVIALNRRGLKRTEIMEIISQYLISNDGKLNDGQREILVELYDRIFGHASPGLLISLTD